MRAEADLLYPVFQHDTGVVPQSNALFVYSRSLNTFDVLSFASVVHLELMDGSRTVESVGAELADRFTSVPREVIASDVRGLVEFLTRRGYVRCAESPASQPFPLEFADAWSTPKIVHVDVELTKNCNLHCRYCYDAAGSGYSDAPLDRWVSLLETLRSRGLRAVKLSGGEPLHYPEIRGLLDYAAERFIVTVNTNGTLVDDGIADWLATLRLQAVQVSLDSPTPEVNDAMRGTGSWQRAVCGIERLVARGVPVRIACTVHARNEALVGDMKRFASRLGTAITFEVMKPVGSASGIESAAFLTDACRVMQNNSYDEYRGMAYLEVKCQAQLGFVGITHAGLLKPCNLTEDFFDSIEADVVDEIEPSGFLYDQSTTYQRVDRACGGEGSRRMDELGFPVCVLDKTGARAT